MVLGVLDLLDGDDSVTQENCWAGFGRLILLTIESLYSLLHSSNLGPSWLTIPVLVILVMNSRCKTVLYTDGHDGYPLDSAMKDDILSKSANGPASKAFSCYSIGESLILFSSSSFPQACCNVMTFTHALFLMLCHCCTGNYEKTFHQPELGPLDELLFRSCLDIG